MLHPPFLANATSRPTPGNNLRLDMAERGLVPFIGIYDVFSATIAARYYDSLFVSGFSFAASFYGLPDIGFIAWSDLVAFVQRLRPVVPRHHLLVDMDDGFGDPEVAAHVASLLERAGASGVVLEDQKRPRRCGHAEGKQLLELDEYITKLRKVLSVRQDMLVIARTDASDVDDIRRRVAAMTEAGADAILVDAIRDFDLLKSLATESGLPFAFNQIAGGKSPTGDHDALRDAGASLIIYSTPCLFAAQAAVDSAIRDLQQNNGLLPSPGIRGIGVKNCTAFLNDNLARRCAS